VAIIDAYILDTSAITNQRLAPWRLTEVGRSASLWLPQVAWLEIRFSAASVADMVRLDEALAGFNLAEIEPEDFRVAGRLQTALAGAGLKGRKVNDLLVAAVALRLEIPVLHYDHDFVHIASVEPTFAHEWLTPPPSTQPTAPSKPIAKPRRKA
jgi:predicted nucleic acid-binding protein